MLKDVSTKALVEELKTREGVEVYDEDPYDEYIVSGTGPAIILVVTD